jgi:hypothetical protein
MSETRFHIHTKPQLQNNTRAILIYK